MSSSNSFNMRREIYRKMLADELVVKNAALSLKFHIAEPDAESLKLAVWRRKHQIGNAPA